MGMGNVGNFVAHALRGLPNPPPVTLLFHSRDKLKSWQESPMKMRLITDGDMERREGYDAELAIPRRRFHGKEFSMGGDETSTVEEQGQRKPNILYGESKEPIHSLILCTKTTQVLQGLSAVKHRLHKDSVILFLQNGMGVIEEVNREIFPDPQTRPYYMLGINSHGVHKMDDLFTTVHAGFGTIALGLLPQEREREPAPYAPSTKFKAYSHGPIEPAHPATPDPLAPPPTPYSLTWTPNQRYLLRTLLRSPVLCATGYSPPDLLQLQLEKLAVNCVVNPLTVLLDSRNGALLYNYALTRVLRLLLAEFSLVARSLPELQYIPNVEHRFDAARLETVVVGVANATRDNISSMLADVRAGKQTEIEYINGWVVKKGEELGIRCLVNYAVMQMVLGKGAMIGLEIGEGVPFVQGGEIKINDRVRDVMDQKEGQE